jgi:hypothetical protein
MGFKRRLTRWNQKAGGLFLPEEMAVYEKLCFREHVKMAEGFLAIYEFPVDDSGTPLREKGRCLLMQDNLIVNGGRASLASLQRGTLDGGGAFGVLDLGYGAVGNGSGGGAITPQPTDTALAAELTNGVIPRPLLSVSTPPPGPPFLVNLWSFQIGTAQLNGFAIDEASMFCLNSLTMFNYRTFAGQTKSSGFTMEFRFSTIF